MSSEVLALKLSIFLFGLAQKCIVAAIKKYKETADRTAEEEASKAISELEAAKSVATKVQQQITASFRYSLFAPEQIERLLFFEVNSLFKEEIGARFAASDISPESMVDLFVKYDPALENAHEHLLTLASAWLDSIDKAVADDATISRILNLRAQRRLRSELSSMGNQMAKAELRSEQQHRELMEAMSSIGARLGQPFDAGPSSGVPDHLKNQNQRRFDRGRTQLLEGSVVSAELEYRGLIEDLQALGVATDSELLQRSYMNLATSLWEQNKLPEAIPFLEKASEVYPDGWRAKRSRALLLIARNDTPAALPFLRAVRELKPDDVNHLCYEAWALKNCGQIEEALALLRSHEFPDSAYFSTLSLIFLRGERYDEAEQAARKAFSLDPECEVAQSALAYSLGIPIINLRRQRKPLQLAPAQEERARLLEAIKAGEQAAATLRASRRLNSLGELVGNLSPMCAAAGQLEAAISYAQEALRIDPDDVISLTNLWCVQMRSEQHEPARQTAVRLESLLGTVDSWEKKAQALLTSDRPQAVIDDWNDKRSQPDFAGSINCNCLVARALSKRHRTEDGLVQLDALLALYPSDCRLLSTRGSLLEQLARQVEAERDLIAAEQNAPEQELAQVLVDSAMFYSRQGQWRKASERLEKVGAELIHNPLFPKYLICVFNQGDYRQSLKLSEEAIATSSEFVEDYYAIAARSHQLCGNLPRAKELLEELVTRGTNREHEHRGLLAWIYWRLDELPQAYDVLVKGLERHPKDLDMLILISAVCSVLGRHGNALEYAYRAVEAAPDKAPSRLAMVRAALSCPQGFSVEQRYIDAHFQSLSFLQQHEPKVIQRLPIEEDFRSILEMVRTRSGQVREFEESFRREKLPMGVFATAVGASTFKMWSAFLNHPRLRVQMAFGTTDEQRDEQNVARATDSVAVDLLALFTLRHLELLHLLPRMFRRIFVQGSSLESVIEDLRELQQHPEQFTLSYADGQFYRDERTSDQTRAIQSFLKPVQEFLRSPSVITAGFLPETASEKNAQLLLSKCGMDAIAPLLVAKEQAIPLFCDDAVVRGIARMADRIPSFCSQALIRVALQRGILTPTEYQDAIIKLIGSNYTFVSEDAGTLRRTYERDGGHMTQLAKTTINRVNDTNWNSATCLPLLAEFCVDVWRNAPPHGGDSRATWVAEIWNAIVKAKNGDSLILEFQGKLAVNCLAQPAVFTGIVMFAILHVPALSRHRGALYQIMQGAIESVSRVVKTAHPYWPGLSAEWTQQAHINEILRRNGWVKLGD